VPENSLEEVNSDQEAATVPELSIKTSDRHNSGLSIFSSLETPFKMISDTPRFLVLRTHVTPLIKTIQTNSLAKSNTSHFPITPETPAKSVGFNRKSDYSSCSSYYKPDESEVISLNLDMMFGVDRQADDSSGYSCDTCPSTSTTPAKTTHKSPHRSHHKTPGKSHKKSQKTPFKTPGKRAGNRSLNLSERSEESPGVNSIKQISVASKFKLGLCESDVEQMECKRMRMVNYFKTQEPAKGGPVETQAKTQPPKSAPQRDPFQLNLEAPEDSPMTDLLNNLPNEPPQNQQSDPQQPTPSQSTTSQGIISTTSPAKSMTSELTETPLSEKSQKAGKRAIKFESKKEKNENIQIISDIPYTGTIPPVSFPSTFQGPESNTSGETNQTDEPNQILIDTQIPVVYGSVQTNFLKSPYKKIPTSPLTVLNPTQNQNLEDKPTPQVGIKSTSKLCKSTPRRKASHVRTLEHFNASKTPSRAGMTGLQTIREFQTPEIGIPSKTPGSASPTNEESNSNSTSISDTPRVSKTPRKCARILSNASKATEKTSVGRMDGWKQSDNAVNHADNAEKNLRIVESLSDAINVSIDFPIFK
jgi:hypothetical protein